MPFAGQTYHPKISILLLLSMMLFLLAPVGDAVAGFWSSECPDEQAREHQATVTQMSCCPSANQVRIKYGPADPAFNLPAGYGVIIPQLAENGCETAAAVPSCCAACECWIDAPIADAALAPAIQRTSGTKEQLVPELHDTATFLLFSIVLASASDADESHIRPYAPNESLLPAATLPLHIAYCCYLI